MAILLSLLPQAASAANPFDQTVTPIEVGQQMPATQFIDQHGHPFSFPSLVGKTVLVGFVYTRCRDECPLITQKFGRLNRALDTQSYQLVEVSIDPSYDRPPVLSAYAKRFRVSSPRWHLVTGDPQTVQSFTRSAGVNAIDNGRGEILHNSRLLIVSPEGRLADFVDLGAWDPEAIAAQLRHVAGVPSNPFARADFALTKAVAQFCGGSYQVASGIIDLVAAVLIIGAGVLIMLWIRRKIFAQGA